MNLNQDAKNEIFFKDKRGKKLMAFYFSLSTKHSLLKTSIWIWHCSDLQNKSNQYQQNYIVYI